MEIYAVNISLNKPIIDLSRYFVHLSEYRQNRINRFFYVEDSYRCFFAEILIKFILMYKYSIPNHMIRIKLTPHGKPLIPNLDQFHFNISHSGNWVVCAIDSLPIGIDIEKIDVLDLNLAKNFFSTVEYKDLLKKEDEYERLQYFYDLWTLKESYIKTIGKGLSISLNSFTVRKNEKTIRFLSEYHCCQQYYFHQYCIDQNYKLSVCSLNNSFPNTVKIIDKQRILEYLDHL
ncbi:4'-phosphopantetheinyl transferase family protein [Bacillus paramycoides]|uniref:4'-phosphopantetheinyl transferase family protein n=1 Tax=Bacillus paramycoides TaxID=2026194 RepID=UPI0040581910